MAYSSFTLVKTFTSYHPPTGDKNFMLYGHNVDIIITKIVLLLVVLQEVCQLIVMPFSDWWRMKYVRFYLLHDHSPFRYLAIFMLKLKLTYFPWGRKINKYSLLHSFAHRSVIRRLTFGKFDKQSDGRSIRERIKLSRKVKLAIGRTLKVSNGRLSNGQSSLNQIDGASGTLISWACQLETSVQQILVWHIATTLCEFEAKNKIETKNEDRVVAADLSGYCAYLVAFVPDLLPDNKLDAELTCTAVISEAHEYLNDCQSEEGKLKKMMDYEGPPNSILQMGAKLGKELIENVENSNTRWKLLAEFWAEFILFLAPCDDPFAHARNMTSGGEFITHLWALLTHAGIIQRQQIGTAEV